MISEEACQVLPEKKDKQLESLKRGLATAIVVNICSS